MSALQWGPADLRAALAIHGRYYTPQAIGAWCRGANAPADAARPAVASVLGIDLDTFLRAAAGVES
jgi:hypothetical protein